MTKPWDDSLKKLVQADPQAFVSWFVPEASFSRTLSTHSSPESSMRVNGSTRVRIESLPSTSANPLTQPRSTGRRLYATHIKGARGASDSRRALLTSRECIVKVREAWKRFTCYYCLRDEYRSGG